MMQSADINVWEKLAHKYNHLWVQKYSLGPTRREVLKIVSPLIGSKEQVRILEVGCGTGQLIREISEKHGNIDYLGIDVAANMIEIAKRDNIADHLKFEVVAAGSQSDCLSGEFDLILCTHAFPYFPNKAEVITWMSMHSKQGATVIIANSSTNSLKDFMINFLLKATTSKAKYLSIKQMRVLYEAHFALKEVRIIREKKYMPTIALFHLERK